MDFKPLELKDLESVRHYFEYPKSRTCDYSAGGMFMWRNFYRMEYCFEQGIFISKLHDRDGNGFYNLPLAEDMDFALKTVLPLLKKAGEPLRFCTIPEEYVPLFQDVLGAVSVSEQKEFADYLYAASDLIELKGKKFSGQRNHIHQFIRTAADWSFVDISDVPITKVEEFLNRYVESEENQSEMQLAENRMALEVLEHLDTYGMFGGVLFAGGSIAGFSLGEIVHDTLYTHIEKADVSVKGSYQMLTNQFSARFGGEVAYINREDDAGDEGLRRAKEAYHPIRLLKKYIVEKTEG